MELIARCGDRQESLQIEVVPGGYRVTVGASTYQVDRVVTGQNRASLIVDGMQFEVVTLTKGPGEYHVSGDSGSRSVEVTDRLTHLAQVGRGTNGGKKASRVTAYMPGRVVAILAAEGEELEAGTGVVVLEAMKMENEIQIDHAGVVVKRLAVVVGQAVEAGDLLFELE
ncbi:MAG: biotin/lipoyl-binding protein [Thermoanaerobaculia bacterium]|nr:biotin/lipoyl-binding protein [Thermoanaerobaculia bacterium]